MGFFLGHRFLLFVVMSFVLGAAASAHADSALHMSFHMALVKDGERRVGVILNNQGSERIAHGYLVVTLIDARCKPFESIMQTFDNIKPGGKLSLNIPISSKFHSYRLASLAAFDEEGFEVLAVDDNAGVLKAREPEERRYCSSVKGTP